MDAILPGKKPRHSTADVKLQRSMLNLPEDRMHRSFDTRHIDIKVKQGARLERKMSKISLVAPGINEHFDTDEAPKRDMFKKFLQCCGSKRDFMRWSILLLSIYNAVFIPLQFAYRIPFDGMSLVMEVATMLMYACDIYFRA